MKARYCKHCGARIDVKKAICHNCGTSFESELEYNGRPMRWFKFITYFYIMALVVTTTFNSVLFFIMSGAPISDVNVRPFILICAIVGILAVPILLFARYTLSKEKRGAPVFFAISLFFNYIADVLFNFGYCFFAEYKDIEDLFPAFKGVTVGSLIALAFLLVEILLHSIYLYKRRDVFISRLI